MIKANVLKPSALARMLFAVLAAATTACAVPLSNQIVGQPRPVNVDAFIDKRLPLYDQQVMRGVMQNLATSQVQGDVVYFDASGHVYANNPEALARAFTYRAAGPDAWVAPGGETLTTPDNRLTAPEASNIIPTSVACPNPPQTSGGTGPFYRIFAECTSWMSMNFGPDEYPCLPTCDQYPCDSFVFNNSDAGHVTIGGFSGSSEFEMNAFVQHPDYLHGFEVYIRYNGGAPKGYNFKWGCFNPPYAPNLIFTVTSPTLLSGTFKGFVDKRQYPGPNPPPYKPVTLVQGVPSGDGWNLFGTGETTFTNVQIAQKPEKLNSGSHFAAIFYMNGVSSGAGTGSWQNALSGCDIENPTQYDGGPSAPCTGWQIVFPAVHPYPTPPPNSAFFVNAVGQNGLLEVGACLKNSTCDQVPVFQRQ